MTSRRRGARGLKLLIRLTIAALVSPAAQARSPEDLHQALQALPSSASEAEQAATLTAHVDLDDSGRIDAEDEVRAISCGALRELDARSRQRWGGLSIRVAYGVDQGLAWGGERLGFDRAIRSVLDARLGYCGLPALPQGVRAVSLSGDPAADLRAAGAGDGPASPETIRSLLLDAFDRDSSGWLDRPDELRAIGCDVWLALDDSYQRHEHRSVRDALGLLPPQPFQGEVFGISVRLRRVADRAAARCGLEATPPVASTGSAARAGLFAFQEGASLPEISALLRTVATGSPGARIERPSQLRRLDCTLWHLLEAAARDDGGEPWLRLRMGLTEEQGFDGELLHLDPSLRARADRAASRCGLPPEPRRPTTSPVHRALKMLGELTWDERVGELMTDAYGGGRRLSEPSQVAAVPCELWLALEAHVRRAWSGNGMRVIYGLSQEYLWVGGVLGLDVSVRDAADAAVVSCGLD